MTGTAATRPIRVLAIGESTASTPALQTDLSHVPDGTEVTWSTARDRVVQHGPPPDIIVVLQQHPEDNSPQQVRSLLNSFPLARLIVCCGPWCESDGRTRQLWPAACRVPESLLHLRMRRELAVVKGEASPLPLTADRDECWEHEIAAGPTPARPHLAVAISTPDPDIAGWLEAALATAGHHNITSSEMPADVVLFDADPWTAHRAEVLAHIAVEHPGLPIVALAGYPRAAQQQTLREAGVRSVVLKLSPLSELCHALQEATAARGEFRPSLHIVRD
jgi:CheY-like chemotaxis protein